MKRKFLAIIIMVVIFISGCTTNNNDTNIVKKDNNKVGVIGNEKQDDILDNKTGVETSNGATVETNTKINEEISIDTHKQYIKIEAKVLNMRKRPSTNSEIVGSVYENEEYERLEIGYDDEKRRWYKIIVDNQIQVWVAGWFCSELTGEKSKKNHENNEFALYIGDFYYPINSIQPLDIVIKDGETQYVEAKEPYLDERHYICDDLEIVTKIIDDDRGKGEVIYKIVAKREAKTPRGINIGDSLKDLQSAYGNLRYAEDWITDENSPRFNRVYLYIPEGSTTYMAFFLYEKEIVMIEILEGLDFIPGENINERELLGISSVIKEINNMTPNGANIKYYSTKESEEEVLLLDLDVGSTYEVDIDDDGITELMVYLKGEKKSIGIYDVIDGEISYIDINKEKGSYYSQGVENMANIKSEYGKCVILGFYNDDGTKRSEVYKVMDNELIYLCPFSNEVLNETL